ncbi:hypothetical protein IAU60_005779 [Kwoniella sp. DSM 27419]
MLSTAFRAPAKDIELTSPPPDSVSALAFHPSADILAVASWDNNGQSQGKAMYSHQAPVLDLTWSKDGQYLFSSGCDNLVQMYNMQTQQNQQVAQHDAPIKCIEFAEVPGSGPVLITAGWDKKLKQLLVVATGDRQIHVINLSSPTTIYKVGRVALTRADEQSIESPLKWQTRVVKCFPTGDAYPGGDEKKNYSFKCHRYDVQTGSMPGTPAVSGSQHVFAINTMTFHKTQHTFCTGGSDGALTFWDAFTCKDLGNGDTDARPPQFGTPIVAASFNHTHEILAYNSNTTKVMLHPVKPEEVNKKPKRP